MRGEACPRIAYLGVASFLALLAWQNPWSMRNPVGSCATLEMVSTFYFLVPEAFALLFFGILWVARRRPRVWDDLEVVTARAEGTTVLLTLACVGA